jgi:hypothetical protein
MKSIRNVDPSKMALLMGVSPVASGINRKSFYTSTDNKYFISLYN